MDSNNNSNNINNIIPILSSGETNQCLEREEERLREVLREKKRRRSNPEKSLSTGELVDSTETTATQKGASAIPAITASEGRNPQLVFAQTNDTNNQEAQKGSQEGSSRPLASHSHSESRSLESGAFSKSSRSALSKDQSPHSGSRGKIRKRERRRMNREARRRGETPPEDNSREGRRHSGGRGPPPPYSSRGPPPGQWERGGHHPRDYRGPPMDRRGPPPRGEYDYSNYHEGGRSRSPRGHHRGRRGRSRSPSHSSVSHNSLSSRSHGRSLSRSRSHSPRRSRSHSDHNSRGSRNRNRSGSGSRRRSGSVKRSGSLRGDGSRGSRGSGSRKRHRSRSPSSSSSSSSSSSDDLEKSLGIKAEESPFSKDQRTVFVSQLVMRATEKDIRRYFRKKIGCQVKEVILLRDKRTGNHKGCAYVQFGHIEDVNKAVGVAGQPPDFQRFPILVKPSEAEKNYVIQASSSVLTASMMGTSTTSKPMMTADGKLIESQKVYVGSLDPSVTEEHIFALFSQFGQLEKVSLQMDPATKASRGYAFLSYRDPKEANLAIQTLGNQILAGRPIKTGWASQTSTVQGIDIVTSEEFPDDAALRARKALTVLAQMSGVTDADVSNTTISVTAERALEAAMVGAQPAAKTSIVPTVAEARAKLAAQQTAVTLDPSQMPLIATPNEVKLLGGCELPTRNILVHNMFDKDQETGDSWPTEIKEEFEEECIKFGKIVSVTVMSTEPGGKIYACFETVEAAEQCAKNLAGRWFDKRQLRVDYLEDSEMPTTG